MAAFSGIPSWVQASKRKVQRTDEWLTFSKALFDVVAVHMQENGVRSFRTLSPNEKKVLITKAVTTLQDNAEYKDLHSAVSVALDKELSVEMNTASNSKQQSMSKPELIAQECNKAIESILNKWPDAKIHLVQCLNVTLSTELRYILWKAQFHNPAVKQEYLKIVSSSPKKLVSKSDLEISQKCQALLQTDSTLRSLLEIKPASSILRHLLSYHHVRSKSRSSLTDIEYLLAVPFVYCTLSAVIKPFQSTKQQVLTTDAMATLVEEFEMFWGERPDYAKSTGNDRSMNILSSQTATHLRNMDVGLIEFLGELYAKTFKITENTEENALSSLLHPLLRCFFVGYLPLDVVMFIWDQIAVGFDVKEFDAMPYICASLLYGLQHEIKQCLTWRAVESVIRSNLKKQNLYVLQALLNEHKFVAQMKGFLNKEHSRNQHFPVPSAAVLNDLPPWRQWYSNKLASHFHAQRKRTNKSLRPSNPFELEDIASEELGDKASTGDLQLERDNLVEEIHVMRDELNEARKQIREEQQAKFDLQEKADNELERLRRKLVYLQNQGPSPMPIATSMKFGLTEPQYEDSETSSVASAPAPPPTIDTPPETPKEATPEVPVQAVSDPSLIETDGKEPQEPFVEPVTPEEQPKVEEDQSKNVMRDLARRMMQGFKAFSDGDGPSKDALSAQTKSDLASIRRAYELAKIDVAGRPITDEELQNLPDAEKQRISSQLSEATRAQLLKLKFV